MKFKRLIINELIEWKNSVERKPLILRGARQVGKTSVVHQLGGKYKQYIYLNLELDAELFLQNITVEKLVEAIFFIHKKEISLIKDTLLFIDEIQEVPSAINMLRYFYEKFPQLHVIAAGSLLETILKEETRFPVGRVQFKVMHPFSFKEYLMALEETNLVEALNTIDTKPYAVEKIFEHFHTYTLIGGMPEIVAHYVANKNLVKLQPIYADLLQAYMNDIDKYARNSTMVQVIRYCMQQIFINGGKRIAYTNFGASNYKAREVSEALKTMQQAMLLQLVFPFTNYMVPTTINFRLQPKLYVLDVGLMNHFAGLQEQLIGTHDISEVYAGQVAEQIVAQEIISNFSNPLLKNQFWVNPKKGSDAEIDFAIIIKGLIIPIEVKSGKAGKLKSLLQFMDGTNHKMAVRLYKGELLVHTATTQSGKEFTLINLPYFLANNIEKYVLDNWNV
jgi:predicted AAA+ superfamily ATPase